MRRLGTETWAGLAMLAIAIGVAVPTVLSPVEPMIPRGWWIVLVLGFLAALLTTSLATSLSVRRIAFVVATAAAWAAVLTAQSTGLLLILLVVTAATSASIVPLWASLVVVALNTGVVAVVTVATASDAAERVILIGFYALIQVATVLSSATLLREQRMRRQLAAAHVELRAAAVLLSESARTAERLRISRELHDLIGHQLTVLTLEIETARHLDGPGAREHLDRADGVARDLLRDVRATVGRLRTEAPDLETALTDMTAALPGLDVSIAVDPRLRVDEPTAAALLRAAQEIVTNTLRHAEAERLGIEVRPVDGVIELTGRDDGRGEDDPTTGNGLLGLRERIAELGGTVEIDGAEGFRVTVRVPAP